MAQKSFQDYYELFDLPVTASQSEISEAWRQFKSTYSSKNVAIHSLFTEVELADVNDLADTGYTILSNPVKRAAYNELLNRKFPDKYPVAPLRFKMASMSLQKNLYQQNAVDGTFLKDLRAESECTLSELSEITKIKRCYLQALENNELDDLPAAVFVRGYVAQISKVFGLDEKAVCRSYMNYFNAQKI